MFSCTAMIKRFTGPRAWRPSNGYLCRAGCGRVPDPELSFHQGVAGHAGVSGSHYASACH